MRKMIVTGVLSLSLAAGCGGSDVSVGGSTAAAGSSTGNAGTSGGTGASGPSGSTGATGANGTAGASSGAGTSGTAGATGSTTGSSGATTGTAGTAGSSGVSGTSMSGASGGSRGPVDGGLDARGALDAEAPDDDGGCNAITNMAPSIRTTVSDASAPPPATGGTLMTGTYYLTQLTAYGGSSLCAGFSVSGIIVISTPSATVNGVVTYDLGMLLSTRISGSYTVDQTSTLNITPTCSTAGGGATSVLFTATPTQITIQQAVTVEPACGTALEVYTKQ